jgi:hypothetical protein
MRATIPLIDNIASAPSIDVSRFSHAPHLHQRALNFAGQHNVVNSYLLGLKPSVASGDEYADLLPDLPKLILSLGWHKESRGTVSKLNNGHKMYEIPQQSLSWALQWLPPSRSLDAFLTLYASGCYGRLLTLSPNANGLIPGVHVIDLRGGLIRTNIICTFVRFVLWHHARRRRALEASLVHPDPEVDVDLLFRTPYKTHKSQRLLRKLMEEDLQPPLFGAASHSHSLVLSAAALEQWLPARRQPQASKAEATKHEVKPRPIPQEYKDALDFLLGRLPASKMAALFGNNSSSSSTPARDERKSAEIS